MKYIVLRFRETSKQFKIAASVVGSIIVLSVMWYLAQPKMADVDALAAQNNSIGLCELIEDNGKTDRHLHIVRAAAKAVLNLSDSKSVERLAAVIQKNEYNQSVRLAIIHEFAENNIVVPNVLEYVVNDNCPTEVRQALIQATNKVNSSLFDEKIEKDLNTAKSLIFKDPDAAIQAVTNTKIYDVNGAKTAKINNMLYEIYAYKVKSNLYPNKSDELKNNLAIMCDIPSTSRIKDEFALKHINELIAQAEELTLSAKQYDPLLESANLDIQRIKERADEVNAYLKETIHLKGLQIGRLEENTYEIVVEPWKVNERAVLKATRNVPMWFDMPVRRQGTKQISIRLGGNGNWPYYVEDYEYDAKSAQLAGIMQELNSAENKRREIANSKRLAEDKIKTTQSQINQLIQGLGGKESR